MAEDNPDLTKIPPELEAEMTPAVKAFVLALIARVDQLEKQVADLTGENKGSKKTKVPRKQRFQVPKRKQRFQVPKSETGKVLNRRARTRRTKVMIDHAQSELIGLSNPRAARPRMQMSVAISCQVHSLVRFLLE